MEGLRLNFLKGRQRGAELATLAEPPVPEVYEEPDTEAEFSVTPLDGFRGFTRRWWVYRRWLVPVVAAVLLVAVLLSTAAIVVHSRQPYLTYARVVDGNLALSFQTNGTLRSAIYGADFAVSGTVAEIDVTVGQQVAQGDTLAKLNTALLQDAVSQAQAASNGAGTALSGAQTNQDKVQAAANALVNSAFDTEQVAIYRCHHEANPPTNCVGQAESQYASAQATADSMNAQAAQQTNIAQAQYDTAKAALQTAQDNLGSARLIAPHAGTIAAVNGNVGQTSGVNAAGNSFIEIADLNALQITTMVDQSQVGNVQPQDTVHFTVPSFKNRNFSGTVSGISPFGQATRNSVLYPMTIDVDSQSLGIGVGIAPVPTLLPGMTANLTVLTAQRFAVRLIPNSAITFAHTASNPKQSALISKAAAAKALDAARQMLTELQNSGTDFSQEHPELAYVLVQVKGKWVAEPVVLGLTDGTNYEVLAGLNLHDKVATGEQRNWITILANR